ncbi:MAG: hypothetical protein KBS66_08365 [Eubacterium sp.]|nr:hypothetical protein [Candidatus Colimonas fimequi]
MLSKRPVLVILSLVIAVFLWGYVMGTVDPSSTVKVSNIPVQIENQAELNDRGLAVLYDREFQTSVNIKGKRSLVTQVKRNGIEASVDVSKAKRGDNELVVKFTTPAGVSVDSVSNPEILVKVEDLDSKDVKVKVVFDNEDSDDNMVRPWAIETDPEVVTVMGAKSAVKKVRTARVDADAGDAEADVATIPLGVTAVDESGEAVVGVTCSVETVRASIQKLNVKVVPLKLRAIGYHSGKLKVSGIVGPTSVEVLVAGDAANITSIEGVVDLSNVNGSGVYNQSIDVQLPQNVYMDGELTDKAKVTLTKAD